MYLLYSARMHSGAERFIAAGSLSKVILQHKVSDSRLQDGSCRESKTTTLLLFE